MQINRLDFNEKQLKIINNLSKEKQEILSIICSALAIDSLYIFSTTDKHPLGDFLCDIADKLRIEAGVTQEEYCYLCGMIGINDLDKLIEFIILK